MSMNDPLGDMLTRIRNAQQRRRGTVTTPGSKMRGRVLDVLKSEGYIRDYSQTDAGNGRTEFSIELKYHDNQPVIRTIKRVSKPGRRVYAGVDAVPRGQKARRGAVRGDGDGGRATGEDEGLQGRAAVPGAGRGCGRDGERLRR